MELITKLYSIFIRVVGFLTFAYSLFYLNTSINCHLLQCEPDGRHITVSMALLVFVVFFQNLTFTKPSILNLLISTNLGLSFLFLNNNFALSIIFTINSLLFLLYIWRQKINWSNLYFIPTIVLAILWGIAILETSLWKIPLSFLVIYPFIMYGWGAWSSKKSEK